MPASVLKGKTVLITGGTGSFGNAFLDFAQDGNTQFIVYSRDEQKQYSMYIHRGQENIRYVVGDIRDRRKLKRWLKGVDYVLHAAALKQVPTGENFPEEVIRTNILGTKNVIEAAEECKVKKVVNLSTDKAVYPINAYGMSKALAEKILSAHRGHTVCVSLRYGNVLGSRGSVIPVFLDRIAHQKPLTITNFNMTRFLLPLSHAISLALKCLEEGEHGDLFVIKPPACTLRTLVDALELHFGRKLEIIIIGIRPGEKVDETLLTSEELIRASEMEEDGIMYVKIPKLDKDMGDYFFRGQATEVVEPFTSANTIQYNAEQTLEMIKQAGIL